MGELRKLEVATQEESARVEALAKIGEFFGDRPRKGDVYLENLYMGSGKWSERIRAAKDRVPLELSGQADRFHITMMIREAEEGGPAVPPELLAYKAEVDSILEDFDAFSEALSDEDIFKKALAEYDEAFEASPKKSYEVAGYFLDARRKQRAAERVVEVGMKKFRTAEDVIEKLEGSRAVMEHYEEIRIEPAMLKELI